MTDLKTWFADLKSTSTNDVVLRKVSVEAISKGQETWDWIFASRWCSKTRNYMFNWGDFLLLFSTSWSVFFLPVFKNTSCPSSGLLGVLLICLALCIIQLLGTLCIIQLLGTDGFVALQIDSWWWRPAFSFKPLATSPLPWPSWWNNPHKH